MAGEEDAMNVIDKLNQEFDVIMDKNIQLEKEKLELYKELHKLKFNLGIARGGLDNEGWCGYVLYCSASSFSPGCDGIQDVIAPSPEFWEALDGELEKNVILKEIYDVPALRRNDVRAGLVDDY
tara:strand:- start:241 stop:612 length:372 start_codon:yes stop_codon:yes gene_type:complete